VTSLFAKPVVVVSKCLGFAKCRYNEITIPDEFVEKLKDHVQFVTVCPELEIGLGVPRLPIRVVSIKKNIRLMQPATKNDLTDEIIQFIDSFVGRIKSVDGFILKSRSPSCGIKDVKIYAGLEKAAALGKGAGFLGRAVLNRFACLPVEDENRLKNLRIREHFLTKLFTLACFRTTSKSMKGLVQFHTKNKFLLMAYSQKELKILGQIIANQEGQMIDDYEKHLFNAFMHIPRSTSNINIFMHAFGYFKKKLIPKEKNFFFEIVEKYSNGKITLSAICLIIKSWIIRFNEDYLAKQTFFESYPAALTATSDSGKN